jgi:hypothetical protein
MTEFYIKQNDTRPDLIVQLLDGSGDAVALPNGTEVKFFMRKNGRTAPKVNGVVSTIDDPGTGKVRHSWLSSHTDEVGNYLGEFQVVFPDDSIETFPNDGYIDIQVMAQAG